VKLIAVCATCRALSYCAAWISGNGCVPINFLMVRRDLPAPCQASPQLMSLHRLCRRTPLPPKSLVYSCGSGSSTALERYVFALSSIEIFEFRAHPATFVVSRTRARPSPHPPSLPSLTRKPRKFPKSPVSRATTFRSPSVT
jgi:hypothetical protein